MNDKKNRRSQFERAIVWGVIAILMIVGLTEARARFGYSWTLSSIQQEFKQRGEAALIDKQEIESHISGLPSRSELSEGKTKYLYLSWKSLFSHYNIRLTFGLEGEVVAFDSNIDLSQEQRRIAEKKPAPQIDKKYKKEIEVGDYRRVAEAAFANAKIDKQEPNPEAIQKVRDLSKGYQPQPLPKQQQTVSTNEIAKGRFLWMKQLLLDNYKKYGDTSPKWNKEATTFLINAAGIRIGEKKSATRMRAIIASGDAVLTAGCLDPLIGYLNASLKVRHVRKTPASVLNDAFHSFGEQCKYPLSFVFKVTIFDADLERWAKLRAAYERKGAIAKTDSVRLIPDHNQTLERRYLLDQIRRSNMLVTRKSAVPFLKAVYGLVDLDPWLKSMIAGLRFFEAGKSPGKPFRTYEQLTEQRWKYLTIAQAHFLDSWYIDDKAPESATHVLATAIPLAQVQDFSSIANEPIRFWFDQAIEAQSDHLPAYNQMRHELELTSTYWGVSSPLIAFGKECLETGRFDTSIPSLYGDIVNSIARLRGNHIYGERGVYEGFQQLFHGYADAKPQNTHLYMTHLLAISVRSNQPSEAIKLLNELGDNVDNDVLKQYQYDVKQLRRVLLSEHPNHRLLPGLGPAFDVAYVSNSDHMLVANGNNGIFGLWDINSKSLITELKHKNEFAVKCAVSADGKLVATTGGKGNVFVWDMQKKSILQTLKHNLQVTVLHFSPDGNRLATATVPGKVEGGHLCVWDCESGDLIAKRIHPDSRFHDVEFTDDSKHLFVAGGTFRKAIVPTPGILFLWDYEHDKIEKRYILFTGSTFYFSINHAKNLLAVSGWDEHFEQEKLIRGSRIKIVDLSQEEVIRTFNCGNTVAEELQFLNDTDLLLVGGTDASIQLWDSNTPKLISKLEGHRYKFWKLATNTRADQLASLDAGAQIKFWKLQGAETPTQVQASLLNHPFSSYGQINVDAVRKRIWTHHPNVGVTLWSNATSNPPERTFTNPQIQRTLDFDISPDGKTVAMVGGTSRETGSKNVTENSGFIRLCEVSSGKILHTITRDEPILCVSFSPDGRTLATGGADKNVVLWNLETHKPWPWGTLTEHNGTIRALAFSPQGKYIATGSEKVSQQVAKLSGTVKLWRLPANYEAPGLRLTSLQTSERPGEQGVQSIVFSPNGKTLAVGDFKETQILAVDSLKKISLVPGRSLVYSHDGSSFATGGYNELKVFSGEPVKLLKTIPLTNAGPVFSIKFLSKSHLIARFTNQNRLVITSIPTGEEVENLDWPNDINQ